MDDIDWAKYLVINITYMQSDCSTVPAANPYCNSLSLTGN